MDEKISRITFGTMRLIEKGVSVNEASKLFEYSINSGINTFHISKEYSSYDLFCDSIKRVKNKDIRTIVKIASPHFDEHDFSPITMVNKIEDILSETRLESISIIQWMWRSKPIDDTYRISKMQERYADIKYIFDKLKSAGKILSVGCFPYTTRFMDAVIDLGLSDYAIDYLNFWEDNLILSKETKGIALRPLYASKAINNDTFCFESILTGSDLFHSLNYPLSNPLIHSAVVSMSNYKQIDEVINSMNKISPDMKIHNKYKEVIQNVR